jgi:hypothetical protein
MSSRGYGQIANLVFVSVSDPIVGILAVVPTAKDSWRQHGCRCLIKPRGVLKKGTFAFRELHESRQLLGRDMRNLDFFNRLQPIHRT